MLIGIFQDTVSDATEKVQSTVQSTSSFMSARISKVPPSHVKEVFKHKVLVVTSKWTHILVTDLLISYGILYSIWLNCAGMSVVHISVGSSNKAQYYAWNQALFPLSRRMKMQHPVIFSRKEKKWGMRYVSHVICTVNLGENKINAAVPVLILS